MAADMVLLAKQINQGQSEIWLESDDTELTIHRTLATNEVVNVVRRHTPDGVFKAFYASYHAALNQVASLASPYLDTIATELKLKT